MLGVLTPDERMAASFSPTVLVEGGLTLSVLGDVASSELQDQVKAAITAELCDGYGPTCSIKLWSATSNRRSLEHTATVFAGTEVAEGAEHAGLEPASHRRLQSGTLTFAITRDLLSAGETKEESEAGLSPVVELSAGEPYYYGELEAPPKKELEFAPVFLPEKGGSILDMATPVVSSFGPAALAALHPTLEASVVGKPAVNSVSLIADVVTLGTDVNKLKDSQISIKSQLASDLDISVNTITMTDIGVYHPPLPPPSPPPSPYSPPAPPLTPPSYPTNPPYDFWYTRYFENEGCDPECVGGCRRMRWSSPYAWQGQGLALGLAEEDSLGWPGWKSNVTIKRCTTVVLDVDINVQLYSLVVWGTLEIENRAGAQYTLRSTCINIKCVDKGLDAKTSKSNWRGPPRPGQCGRIIAGSKTEPFVGRLEFLLSGDELTESHQCGGLKGKYFDVERGSELALYGNTAQNVWGRLRKTAKSGDYTLFIQGRMDWLPGDQVIVATSGPNADQTEWLTLFATRHIPNPNSLGGWDTEINCNERLQYTHIAVTEQHAQWALDMRVEVGLYMRPTKSYGPAYYSIKMAGVDSLHWDFSFKTMKKSLLGLLFTAKSGSKVTMYGVRFEDGGTYKPGLVSIREGRKVVPVIRCETDQCDIQRSNICPRMGHGIEAKNGGYLANNIFWQSFVGLRVSGKTQIINNVVYGATDSPGGEPDVSGGGDLDSSDGGIQALDCGSKMTMIGNSVPGAGGPCIAFNGFCMKRSQFQNNSGHGCMLGFAVKGAVTEEIQDLTFWQIRLIGLWGYSHSRTPTISNVRFADFASAFFWGNIGGNSEAHVVFQQTITIKSCLFVSRSVNNPRFGVSTGILLPIFASVGYSISPGVCGPLGGHWTKGIYGMEHPTGSNPAIAGEVRVYSNTFVRFYPGSNVLQTTMRGGMESSDAVPPHFFKRSTIDEMSRTNLANLPPPKRDWITPNKCVVLDCDGPKHVILHDLDGSLTGSGPDSSILAKAEHMNELRADTSKFTWYKTITCQDHTSPTASNHSPCVSFCLLIPTHLTCPPAGTTSQQRCSTIPRRTMTPETLGGICLHIWSTTTDSSRSPTAGGACLRSARRGIGSWALSRMSSRQCRWASRQKAASCSRQPTPTSATGWSSILATSAPSTKASTARRASRRRQFTIHRAVPFARRTWRWLTEATARIVEATASIPTASRMPSITRTTAPRGRWSRRG